MKKILLLFLSFILSFCMCACGQKEDMSKDVTESDAGNQEAPKELESMPEFSAVDLEGNTVRRFRQIRDCAADHRKDRCGFCKYSGGRRVYSCNSEDRGGSDDIFCGQ